ncbi:tRNA lysidine(34) synthetase TilS [Deinococcus aerophilus]|uniref:Multifunctional fusion protein n=1 Tax=Deinococcus aerophilus TaxID=522488 RepID=A0ABQ2GQ39_9DEIO|nr:tRNA lysidine(34) synthetase TilS [Deinococcus aerophilus]GGM06136.1 tRNA(Ile)-lysidine synthase [Deinococcus aerophilus]
MSPLIRFLAPYAGQVVVLGVSGGADSVALLRGLLLAGARPVAVHLDHALRPESAEDAGWVAALAGALEVPYHGARVDVGVVAARRGWNLEDAARRVRYDLLGRVAREHAATAVLTAHTRRDQAETVLMEVLRGEGVIQGIPSVRGRVQRPWLAVARPEVEAFLRDLGQGWREDASNADPRFTRAWLRREVMPVLSARFPGVEAALARLAHHGAEDDAALEALAARLTLHAPLRGQPEAVLRRWVRRQLQAAGLEFHTSHLQGLARALADGQTAHLTLPGARDVTVTAGRLDLGDSQATSPAAEAEFALPPGWHRRQRMPGDRIRLPGGTRKLSDVLTDLKVPRGVRDAVPLLVSGDGVQWVGLNPAVWAVGARETVGAAPGPWHTAMGEALTLARLSAQEGEVPVGAVVLGPDGAVVGRGRNTSRADGDMTRHAELAALREAAVTLGTPYLGDCTLVVTLEPCPMCLGAALEARVGAVVYGAANPKAGALGGVSDLLGHRWGHAPAVTGGVRAGEAARLLRDTFRGLRERAQARS